MTSYEIYTLRRKEDAELKSALNESLTSQNLLLGSQDDYIFGDSASKRPKVAMPSKSNKPATVTSGALAAQTENDKVDCTVELANARKFQANFTQTLVASSASTSKNMKRYFQSDSKGQIISKGLFGILGFFPKMNEQIRF